MNRFLPTLALVCCAVAPAAFADTPLFCGQPQSATATAAGAAFSFAVADTDSLAFRFTAAAAGLTFAVTDSTGSMPVNARGNPKGLPQVTQHADTFPVIFDFQTRGSYKITISGAAAGGYQVTFASLIHPCTGVAGLTCGSTLKAAIGPGQMQIRQFTGKTGDNVLFKALVTGGDKGASLRVLGFDSAAQIQTTGPGQALSFDMPQGSAFSYKLTSDGLQTFLLQESSAKLSVNFSMNVVDLNGPCSQVPAACGTAADGSISDMLASTLYTLTANKDDIYQFKLRTTDATGGLAAQLAVFDPSGAPVTTTDPTVGPIKMPSTGPYTVLVQDRNLTSTGKYTVSFARLNSPCNAQPLGCGISSNGQVNGVLRMVNYAVDAQAGDVYLLRLLRTGTGGFAPRVEVYVPGTGSQVQGLTATDLASATFTAPASGAYNVIAFDGTDGTQSGTFGIWMARLNRPCDGTSALGCGVLAPGSITQPLQSGMFSYSTAAGDAFTTRLIDTGGSLQTALQVYDPRGVAVPVVAGSTKAVDVANSPGGAYTVLVTDQSRSPQQGTFAVQAFNTKGVACGSHPAQGQHVSGLVSGPVPYTAYIVSASAGDALAVRTASYTPGFSSNVDIYDPTGKRVASGTSVAPPPLTLSGSYTVIAGAATPRTAGSYAFAWQLLNNPVAAPLQCGQTSSGTLGASNQFWYYTLPANDGDLLKLLLAHQPATVNAQLELFDPKGNRLSGGTAPATGTAEIDRKIAAGGAGNYLVLVSPASASAESGAFALSLERPNNPCSATPLPCGQTILRTVTALGQLDAFTIAGNPGDQITIQVALRSGTYTPVTELYDQTAANNLPLPGSPGGTSLNATLQTAGPFTLTIHDRSGVGTGSYRVGLQRVNNACTEDDSQKPTITLRRPTGGEVIAGGSPTPYQIVWQSDDNAAVTAHAVRLSTDAGKTFQTIGCSPAVTAVSQSCNWLVPADIPTTRTAMIQVTATDRGGNSQSATSDLVTLVGSGFTPNASVTYGYDSLNRVASATYGDGRAFQYSYDPAGNLVGITVK